MYEDVPGYDPPVDHSGVVLEAGGLCPSPQGIRSAPFGPDRATGGVGVSSPALPGQSGLEQPDPFSEAKPRQPPLYLVHTANLEAAYMPEPLYQPTKCDPKFIVIGCKCGREGRKIVPSACMSLDCIHCWSHVAARRAARVFHRLVSPPQGKRMSYRLPTVIYTVFTIPEHLRDRFLERAEWQKVRKLAWKILKEKFGARFAVEATHPTGDAPEFNFQPHLNFLWIQRSGYKPFLDKGLLWGEWGKALGLKEARVWSRYSDKIKQIHGWAWYVGRPFPGTHKWTGPMRWYGTYPKAKEFEHVTCSECGSHYHVIGFLYSWQVEQWYAGEWKTGLAPPWQRDSEISPLPYRKAISQDTSTSNL